MAECTQTSAVQYVYRCEDGKEERIKQVQWTCTLGNNTWIEWRDVGEWTPTGEDC